MGDGKKRKFRHDYEESMDAAGKQDKAVLKHLREYFRDLRGSTGLNI